MTRIKQSSEARRTRKELDEALDAAANGAAPTSDDAAPFAEQAEEVDREEIDVTGDAAGLHDHHRRPLSAVDPIAVRDAHRWELDPASAEDAATRKA